MRTECHALTDVGGARSVNEDRFFASDELGVWAVADGMGGLDRGDRASSLVVEALAAIERHDDLEIMLARVCAALEAVNEVILAEAARNGRQMGTTAVVLVVRERRYGLAWVGDSRAYLLRQHRLYRLTRDHSQVQELVDHGVIDAAAAATHPLRNVLNRAVGVASPLLVDSVIDVAMDDDLLLLCSDGLYGVIGEAEMETVLASQPLERAAQVMVERCHELGAPDNITLVGVITEEVTLVRYGTAPGG